MIQRRGQGDIDTQLQVIEEQAAARQERVDGYRDQKMAKLFCDSEWSQQELAEHLSERKGEEVSREWVGKHLLFGRFLTFFGTTCTKDEFKMPPNLTEGAFRKLWKGTESAGDYRGHKANSEAAVADEQRRFGLVLGQLKEGGLRRKPPAAVTTGGSWRGWLTRSAAVPHCAPPWPRPGACPSRP